MDSIVLSFGAYDDENEGLVVPIDGVTRNDEVAPHVDVHAAVGRLRELSPRRRHVATVSTG